MPKYFTHLTFLLILVAGSAFAQSDLLGEKVNVNFASEIQTELLKAATSDETTPYDFMLLCKRFQVYGTSECVPAVASKLNVPEKSHAARMTLEILPCREAGDALRAALANVTDPTCKAGVLDSLGRRGEAASADAILPFLNDSNETIRRAAIFALARLGGPTYADALAGKACPDALLLYGEQLRKNGHKPVAASIFQKVIGQKVPAFYHQAAYMQWLLCDDADTSKNLAAWLTGDCPVRFDAAVRATYFLGSDAVCKILMESYDKVAPERQLAILAAVGNQKNAGASYFLLRATTSDDPAVSAAAVLAMKDFADVASFRLLFENAALSDNADLVFNTLSVMEVLPPSVDTQVCEYLADTQSNAKFATFALRVIEARKIEPAHDTVLNLAQKSSANQSYAIRALGAIARFEDLPVLQTLVESEATASTARIAMTQAFSRIEDRSACVRFLEGCLEKSRGNLDLRTFYAKMLDVVAAPESWVILEKLANSTDLEAQNCATNVLGRTNYTDAAPILLKLANKEGYTYANRALRGYLRLARQFPMAAWRRLAMIQDAQASPAFTDKERETVAIILKQYGLDPTRELTNDQKKLRNYEIVSAIFGLEDPAKQADATRAVADAMALSDSLTFTLPDGMNKLFGDPAPGVPKFMFVKVRDLTSGQILDVKTTENGAIRLP